MAQLSTAIHTSEDNADSILETMGLSGELLAEVLRRGLAQYLVATADHPPPAGGTFMYYEMVRSLRQQLRSTGWEQDDSTLHLVLNKDLGIAIAVRAGDAATGNPKRNPSFKHPESTTMHEAVGGNNRQLLLAEDHPVFSPPAPPQRIDFSSIKTWWLLHHVDTLRGVMHAELSLPVSLGDNGQAIRWETRIILASTPFDDEPKVEPVGDDSGDVAFDFDVRKKVS